MSRNPIHFSRGELYALVWSKPIAHLARELGVSDVAIAKACRRSDIPIPQRGYWARRLHGKVDPIPELRQPSSVAQETVTIWRPGSPRPRQPEPSNQVAPIEVPHSLLRPHQLVVHLRAAMRQAREDKGVLEINHREVLRVRVSRNQMTRALCMLDVLVKEFAKRGHTMRIDSARRATYLTLREGEVSFRLDERTRRIPSPPPERSGQGEAEAFWWRPKRVLVGTGELSIDFSPGLRLDPTLTKWRDRRDTPLESQLHQVIAAIPDWEKALEQRRHEREEWATKAREEEEIRLDAEREARALKEKRQRVVEYLKGWERARRLLSFAEAVSVQFGNSKEVEVWVDWVREQAALIDPLSYPAKTVLSLERIMRKPSWLFHSTDRIPDWWEDSY